MRTNRHRATCRGLELQLTSETGTEFGKGFSRLPLIRGGDNDNRRNALRDLINLLQTIAGEVDVEAPAADILQRFNVSPVGVDDHGAVRIRKDQFFQVLLGSGKISRLSVTPQLALRQLSNFRSQLVDIDTRPVEASPMDSQWASLGVAARPLEGTG